MSEIALELAGDALVGIKEARRFVYRDEDDSSRDGQLIDAINQASASIARHCRREFVDTTADPGPDVRTFTIHAGGFVDLSPYDLRSLEEVIRYTDRDAAYQQTLTSSQYRLLPAGRTPEGTYLHLKLADPTLCELEPGFGWQCTVEGDWGMAAVPSDVKLACLQWVKNIVENPGSYSSIAYNGMPIVTEPEIETVTASPAGMPAAVRRRLAAVRRYPVVM